MVVTHLFVRIQLSRSNGKIMHFVLVAVDQLHSFFFHFAVRFGEELVASSREYFFLVVVRSEINCFFD